MWMRVVVVYAGRKDNGQQPQYTFDRSSHVLDDDDDVVDDDNDDDKQRPLASAPGLRGRPIRSNSSTSPL
jgi:hypothetical protein